MDSAQKQMLNQFFVQTFNKILSLEENAITRFELSDLSIREMHIIEAVSELEKTKSNTMTRIAGRLSISVGALTTAINALVKKMYVKRGSKEDDRRVVLVYLTDKGRRAEELHAEFHNDMIESVGAFLDDEGLGKLIISLELLSKFFNKEGDK